MKSWWKAKNSKTDRFWLWGRCSNRFRGSLEAWSAFACQVLSTWPLSWVGSSVVAPGRLPFPSPMHESEKWKWSHSVVFNFLQPHGLYSPPGSSVHRIFQDRIPEWIAARSHHGRSHPWQRSCGENLTGKGRSGLKGPPGSARASTPKPESVCLTILCLSPTLLTLTGGYPRPPFSGKSQLRALVNKCPGHDRSVSIQTPLMAF